MINAHVLLDDGEYVLLCRETVSIALPKTFRIRVPEMHVDFNITPPADNPVIPENIQFDD